MWRARRWRFLLNIIDRLPGHSHYGEAVADDDDAAEVMLALSDGSVPSGPAMRLSQWSPEIAELRNLAARIEAVVEAVAVTGHADPPKFPRLPVPEVAMDRVKGRKALERHHRIVAQVLPPKDVNDGLSG